MRPLILMAFLWSPLAFALTEKEVVASSLRSFPQVIESLQFVEQVKQEVINAEGAFDGKFKGEIDSRTEGYYNGDAYKIKIEKPIAFLNSRVYTGHRQSFGEFPSYEGKSVTLEQGEVFAGASVSLLRNSLIDSKRYFLRLRKQDHLQAEFKLKLMQITVQTMALKAYWTWVVKGQEMKVYQGILELAQMRARQIEKRVNAGDLARIYLTENQQYVRRWQASIAQSQQEFQESGFYLSLFYRDENGKTRLPLVDDLPTSDLERLNTVESEVPIYIRSLKESLDLKIINSQKNQADLDVRMGTNSLLPKVDLNFEWSQDQGRGQRSLANDENRIMLNLEVPFEYNKGLGKKRAGKAKLSQLETKKSWTKEKLLVEVKSLVMKLNSYASIYSLTRDQVSFSEKLANAERKKFARGASDLILVNLRDQNYAESQIKKLKSLLQYYYVDAELKNVSVHFISPPQ